MMTYREVHENRVLVGLEGRGSSRDAVPYEAALDAAAANAKRVKGGKVAVVLGAPLDRGQLRVRSVRKGRAWHGPLLPAANRGWEGDSILRNADNNPNRAGVRKALGADPKPLADLITAVEQAEVDAVFALGHVSAESEEELAKFARLDVCVVLASNAGALTQVAGTVVPVASWAESSGTFINAAGTAQGYRRAIPAQGRIQPAWLTLHEVAKRAGVSLGAATLQDVRGAIGLGAQEAALTAGASA
ncbi:MAG: molybdopterin-dependent oxidoreductase [Polyangiales bacterium]